MTDRRQIVRHLRMFNELGVQGVSRDASWRTRATAAEGDEAPAPVAIASGAGSVESEAGDPPLAREGAATVDSDAALAALRANIGDCTRCPLHAQGRRQVVFGVGNAHADLMFVGEAPGADEDREGEPFVGRAGQLLTKIIEAIGLRREDVYIANVIKCRPPGNRNPEPIEVATCEPFLREQIAIIQPKVIVALGTFAAHLLLASDAPISRLRGRVHQIGGGIRLVPTFHPAFLLRSPERKRDTWEDMKIVRALLAESA
ncbi:MAG TPA: uracil-DNA glycosylase [Vicinamibacterales bacterium]|jgi:DNA polymerase|nr:uracil-DNA glycosylase [Vicinamibacterales bacterium]